MAGPLSAWNNFWQKSGSNLEDIYSQVRNRKKPKGKRQGMAPVTTGMSAQKAQRQLAPKPQGQTAGQKRSIYAGLEKDLKNP